MSDEDGACWVDAKKRPRPPPLSGASVQVSRQSGLVEKNGTFGKSMRFAKDKVQGVPGASSPYGHLFYSRNQLYKIPLEMDKSCTQGIGERPGPAHTNQPPAVGPGSYNIVSSAAGPRSPLDGPEFCTCTLKVKLQSSLGGLSMPSPGPHARYEVRGDLDKHLPQYAKHKPLLSHGHRAEDMEGRGEPGPGSYNNHLDKSVATAASCPNLHGAGERCMEAVGGTKRCLKSTFGIASRFEKKGGVPNSSPGGDRYYAHSKIWNSEEYLAGARTCGFGASGKTDMANPLKGHLSTTSAVTYFPEGGYSAAGKTSAFDGIATRQVSPVHQFSKNAGGKHDRKTPKATMDSPKGQGAGSPGGGAPPSP